MVSSNMIHCFIYDGKKHDTFLLYQVQTILVDYLTAHRPYIEKLIYFSDGCGGQYKNCKNFTDLCSHKHDFGTSADWVFLGTSYCKSPCDGIDGAVKTTCS